MTSNARASVGRDPWGWTLLIALVFAALAGWRLGIPSKTYFDEVHYVPAARRLLQLVPANVEHPLVGKEAIAAAIALLGDEPWAWRVPSLLAGSLGLLAFGRALWWSTFHRFAALAGMVLLATDFAWFIQSRIAMLDQVMAGLAALAFWQVAAAARGSRPRWRLALAGVAIGLAIGAKWSVVPAIAVLGLGLVARRLAHAGARALEANDGSPIPGVSLVEIVFWLASLPLAVYWLSFLPAAFYRDNPLAMVAIVPWHVMMLHLQDSVVQHHPYQSVWWQWAANWRAIWYLYEPIDGMQRGVLLIGNPFTMLAGLPALGWCLWTAIRRRSGLHALVVAGYAASLAMWALSGKPVQFYYHYLVPGTFLIAALALALDALWQSRSRLRPLAPIALVWSAALFAWFLPIIAALPLHDGVRSFEFWMWLASWR